MYNRSEVWAIPYKEYPTTVKWLLFIQYQNRAMSKLTIVRFMIFGMILSSFSNNFVISPLYL